MTKALHFFPIFTLLALFAGCSSEEPVRETTDPAYTLRINLGAEPETLDPALNTSLIGSRVMKGLFEGLVMLDGNSQPQPAAAESWEANDDYTVWTFNLRQDARWHNGDPVTAADFVFGIKRTLTPALGAQYAQNVIVFLKGADGYYEAGGLESGKDFPSIQAVDDYTLRFELENPTPFFNTVVDLTVWYPAHKPTIEEHGDSWSLNPETYIGNGPFRLVEVSANDRIVMEPAETYWDAENIWWKRVEFTMIESLTTEAQAFRTGELDITNTVALPEVTQWQSKPEWNTAPTFGTYYLSINTQQPPFDDARVRRAFQIAVDRKLLTERVLKRGDVPAEGIIPNSLNSPRGGTFREHSGDLIGAHNVEEARRLIREAGYNEDNPLPDIEYIYNTAEDHKIVAEQLQAMWNEAFGIDVRLQNVEWGVLLQRGRAGDYQVMRSGWFGDYLDAMTFMELYETGNSLNYPQYENPEYDELVAGAREETDPVKREDMMIEAEHLVIREDAAICPLFYYAFPMLIKTDIEGIVRNATGDLHYQKARRTRDR